MVTDHTPAFLDDCDVNRCPGCTERFSELEPGHNMFTCVYDVAVRHVQKYGGGRGVDAMRQRSHDLQKEVGFGS